MKNDDDGRPMKLLMPAVEFIIKIKKQATTHITLDSR